ncbi:hypothetical protein BVX98_03930 [bacterium F11]|nr:hypothetical protein BVX98_03930 [bacterium F11]
MAAGFTQPSFDAIELRVEPEYFSPNDDGIQDQTFFSPILHSQKDVTRWQLIVRKTTGKKIWKTTGAGFSALIKWDGRNNKGRVVPDGDYQGTIRVWGGGLKISSPERLLVIDTEPPEVYVAVSTTVLDNTLLDGDYLTFNPEFVDDSPIDRWQLQILDLTGRTVYVHWSTGPVQEIFWDGKDPSTGVLVPQGSYRCALQAWDMAGNESVPSFLDISVTLTAKEMLKQALEQISVHETSLGLIVPLDAAYLFDNNLKKPELTEQGKELLREVSLLVNAYPFADIRLDGYSYHGRMSSKDRHLSSLFAWRVYSFLVKQGNVKPSRLHVKGRGRHAMFDRRAVELEVIKNGVEVRLEGLEEW